MSKIECKFKSEKCDVKKKSKFIFVLAVRFSIFLYNLCRCGCRSHAFVCLMSKTGEADYSDRSIGYLLHIKYMG